MKALVIVIDAFGIGALPDAADYGDTGANTILHVCEKYSEGKWPNLQKLGLGNCSSLLGVELPGCEAVENPSASYGVMMEKSPGKDTTTGHWEIAGIELEQPFTLFPASYPSFPREMVEEFESKTGRKMLGNKSASGTEIIKELGPEHVKTGNPIVYTSADSVFQIAAHEEVLPLQDLYNMCSISREICDKYLVARVIARPFIGENGDYTRTKNRKDFSIELPYPSVFEHLSCHQVHTVGVGKIGDIFLGRGICENYHDMGNASCLERIIQLLAREAERDEFILANLVDTDMLYGHRRDVGGYYQCIAEIDERIPQMLKLLADKDVLIITADHGCDPAFRGTDHTREYAPLLVYKKNDNVRNLKIRSSFADVAQSVCSYFNLPESLHGTSFV